MVEAYPVALVIIGIAIFGAVILPRLLARRPLSMPIIYVAAGFLLFAIPGIEIPNLVENSGTVERLTELVVIIALMGSGLKLNRRFTWTGWVSTWRLLGITMPITIAITALLGWWVLGLQAATALLLGAVIAPTDPVLASDVEAGPPLTDIEEERYEEYEERAVRFALTSEAGLNDGLAFPFTNLAIAVAAAASATTFTWLGEWVFVDVLYRIGIAVLVGYLLGNALAQIIFRLPATSHVAEAMAGAEALAGTFVIYGITELLYGYGFIAVFVGALVLRQFEWEHEYYHSLHDFAVTIERMLMATVLLLFGGAIASGLLLPLTTEDVIVGSVILLLVRPFSGLVGLLGYDLDWSSRAVIAAFGIRGIGSFYYLSYALDHASFREIELLVAAERLWALVGFVVLASIVLHGITASPIMTALDRWHETKRTDLEP